MAKGYWIARVDVHNDEGYKPYALANPAIFQKFGGRFIVRGGEATTLEGEWDTRRIVVIEFPDLATAREWWESEDYAPLKAMRQTASDMNIILVDGV